MRNNKACQSRWFQRLSVCAARAFSHRKRGNALRRTKQVSTQPNSFLFTSKLRMSPKPNLLLRYMTVTDLPQVMEIDRLSFEIPWSEKSYRYEINESNQSFMVRSEEHTSELQSR